MMATHGTTSVSRANSSKAQWVLRPGLTEQLLAAILLLATGCATDAAGEEVEGALAPPPLCDVVETACQTAVLELVAEERGDVVPPLPPIRVITADDYRAELEAAAAAAPPAKPSAFEAPLQELGLLAASKTPTQAAIDQAVRSVIALYRSDRKDVTIIRRTTVLPADRTAQMMTLAHEFTHYLQDRAVGLREFQTRYRTTYDVQRAAQAMVEGEARVIELRARARLEGVSVDPLDWATLFDESSRATLTQIAASSSPLPAASALVYPIGGRFIASVWDGYDRQHVNALFQQMPISIGDWLNGYGDGGLAVTKTEALDCTPPLPPQGFVVAGVDSFGVLGAAALLSTVQVADLGLLMKLRQDRIVVYASATPDPDEKAANPRLAALGAWRLRFADEDAAEAFAQPLLSGSHLRLKRMGREIAIVTGSDETGPLGEDAMQSCPTPVEFASAPRSTS